MFLPPSWISRQPCIEQTKQNDHLLACNYNLNEVHPILIYFLKYWKKSVCGDSFWIGRDRELGWKNLSTECAIGLINEYNRDMPVHILALYCTQPITLHHNVHTTKSWPVLLCWNNDRMSTNHVLSARIHRIPGLGVAHSPLMTLTFPINQVRREASGSRTGTQIIPNIRTANEVFFI